MSPKRKFSLVLIKPSHYDDDGYVIQWFRSAIPSNSLACLYGTSPGKTTFFIVWFKGCIAIEGIHPLEGGFFRRKARRNRRSGMPLENPLIFYPKYAAETLRKQFSWIALYLRLRMIYKRVKRDPARFEYTDLTLEPVTDHEEEREFFQSDAARVYLNKVHRNERIGRGETV